MQVVQVSNENSLIGIKWSEKDIFIAHITENADNERVVYDKKKIEGLSERIHRDGIICPLIVHRIAKNIYEIIDGHRRYRAAKMIGMKILPCRVCDYPLNRDQVRAIMRATDKFHEHWSKYDLAKQCANTLRETGSLSVASARMFMSTQQTRMYAMIGELSGKLLQRIIDCAVPYTFTHAATLFFATNILCKRISMTKDQVVEALVEKWISKKIRSLEEFRQCIKKVPMLKDNEIRQWLESDHGLGVLKAMVEVLPDRNEKIVESVNKTLGQLSHKIRTYEWTFDEIRKVQDQHVLLGKEIRRITENARRKANQPA